MFNPSVLGQRQKVSRVLSDRFREVRNGPVAPRFLDTCLLLSILLPALIQENREIDSPEWELVQRSPPVVSEEPSSLTISIASNVIKRRRGQQNQDPMLVGYFLSVLRYTRHDTPSDKVTVGNDNRSHVEVEKRIESLSALNEWRESNIDTKYQLYRTHLFLPSSFLLPPLLIPPVLLFFYIHIYVSSITRPTLWYGTTWWW